MKKYLLLILSFFLLLSNATFVRALDEGFYSTISFTIGSTDTEDLTYKSSEIVGEYTYQGIYCKKISDLTDSTYQTRIYNELTSINLPPYAEINVGYYWYNNTPNTVNVESVRIPLSSQIDNRGDLSSLLFDIGFKKGVTEANIPKGGKYLEVEGPGLIESDMGQVPGNGIVLTTLTVRPPIEISEYEIEYIDEYISRVTMHVKNTTPRDFADIWVNFEYDESVIFDLDAYEEREISVYKRCTLSETEVNCGNIRIINRTHSLECVMFGSAWEGYINPDSVSVFSKVDGQWTTGAIVRPSFQSFCIRRIAYVQTTPELIVEIEAPQQPEIQTTEEYWQELLNIDVLPVTSKQFNKLAYYLTLLKPFRIDNLRVL
jgi:hypothetical protein